MDRITAVPNPKDVCAIAVTYHPDSDFVAQISSVLPQVGALVIVDNGSAAAEVEMLRQLAANSMITLVLNADNLGIARALNIGVERVAAGFIARRIDEGEAREHAIAQELEHLTAMSTQRGR